MFCDYILQVTLKVYNYINVYRRCENVFCVYVHVFCVYICTCMSEYTSRFKNLQRSHLLNRCTTMLFEGSAVVINMLFVLASSVTLRYNGCQNGVCANV